MKTKTIKVEMPEELYNSLKTSVTLVADSKPCPINDIQDFVGQSFFFRTVTYHIIGKVVKILNGKILVLEQASWIANSGRFMNAIKEGTLNEVEPLGDWFVCLDTVTDFGIWLHNLPKTQK